MGTLPESTQPAAHCTGERGLAYAGQHQQLSDVNAPEHAINADCFRPYVQSSDHLLDFGCGNGGMLRQLSQFVKRAEGLEVNPAARAVAAASGLRIYSSLSEQPSGPTYDKVVSNHVLEHVRNVCGTLLALRAHLVTGGALVVKLPIDDIRERRQRSWGTDDPGHHLWTWTPRLFANVLIACGFEVLESRVVSQAWHPRLFAFYRTGLRLPLLWLFATLENRRQLFAAGRKP
jgi:SAM-dependent methyltransferase